MCLIQILQKFYLRRRSVSMDSDVSEEGTGLYVCQLPLGHVALSARLYLLFLT